MAEKAHPPAATTGSTSIAKGQPLREDTRLLGRLLGDVLRAQTGDDGYARIEAVRQTAIRFRRAAPDEAPGVRADLAGIDRAPDRSATQEHPRLRTGDRAAADVA